MARRGKDEQGVCELGIVVANSAMPDARRRQGKDANIKKLTHISFLEHFYIEADSRHSFDWLSMGKDR